MSKLMNLCFGGKENLKQGRSTDSKKKKKIIEAVELTGEGKVELAYFNKIGDYSSRSLISIFDNHISEAAHVLTDKWAGYIPISKRFNIERTQIL